MYIHVHILTHANTYIHSIIINTLYNYNKHYYNSIDLEETSKRVRHYDIDSVQRYMKFKQEEKKRKANEEKEAQIRAQKERERRLKVNKNIYILFNYHFPCINCVLIYYKELLHVLTVY